jgi:hypothetical protein
MTFSLAFGILEQTPQEQWETQKQNTNIYSFLESTQIYSVLASFKLFLCCTFYYRV